MSNIRESDRKLLEKILELKENEEEILKDLGIPWPKKGD